MMISALKRYIPAPIKRILKWLLHCYRYDRYMQPSYSKEGEDIILNKIFGTQKYGFYIDVGAYHPKQYSNTYSFYLRGWRGINIDAMPGSMDLFKKNRRRDINLEIPVLKEKAPLKYYQFNEPALNGFSYKLSNQRDDINEYKIINVIELEGVPLGDILDKYLPEDEKDIDFMSIDVEGFDLEVLQSNDWDRFRPKVLLVELINSTLSNITENSIYKYLLEQRYYIFGKSVQTVFFISEEYISERGISL